MRSRAAERQPVGMRQMSSSTTGTRYRTAKVDGLDIFYREAGPIA